MHMLRTLTDVDVDLTRTRPEPVEVVEPTECTRCGARVQRGGYALLEGEAYCTTRYSSRWIPCSEKAAQGQRTVPSVTRQDLRTSTVADAAAYEATYGDWNPYRADAERAWDETGMRPAARR